MEGRIRGDGVVKTDDFEVSGFGSIVERKSSRHLLGYVCVWRTSSGTYKSEVLVGQ